MHFLPLLDQNAQPVKAFDEAGCQTSPSPSERSLGPDPDQQTQIDFMSLEDFDSLLLDLDANPTSVRDDVAVAPPTYSDAVTQNYNNNNISSSLGLDQRTLVSDPSLQMEMSPAASQYAGATVPRCANDTLASPQRIDRWLNPAPPGIYMRARPMVWDAPTYERQRLTNEAHQPPTYAPSYAETPDLPPWRRPSIAHVAFQTNPTDHSDVFGPYAHTPASQFDAVPPRHPNPVLRSLTYPPPPNPHRSSCVGPNARIEPWAEHGPSRDTPLPTCAMPGTYPPSPPRTRGTPSSSSSSSYDSLGACCPHAYSTARQRQRQWQGPLARCTSSIQRGCESCCAYPTPPPSPSSTSSVCTDSRCSSPGPGLELRLSLHTNTHTPSHSSSTTPCDEIGIGSGAAPAHTTRLSTPQASVVNISIAFPSPCSESPCSSSSHKDWFYHHLSVSSICAFLLPLVVLVSIGVYLGLGLFDASILSSRSSSSSSSSSSATQSLLHGPLIWRAMSSLLSFVLRMVGDADVKI